MVKLWPKYGDFSIFQDGSRCGLGFSNFENFNAGTLNMAKLRQCVKFCRNRSNRVRDMVLFRFHKMAVAAMLDFQIFASFNNRNSQGQTASPCQISSKSVTCKTVKIALNLSQQSLRKVVLQYHNENSAKNRPNLVHIIILATSVGQQGFVYTPQGGYCLLYTSPSPRD